MGALSGISCRVMVWWSLKEERPNSVSSWLPSLSLVG